MTPPAEDRRDRSRQAASRQVRLESEGDAWRWSYGDTFISGLYALKIGPPLDDNHVFAVNIDPRESPLERIDPARLPEELGSRASADGSTVSTTSGPATATYAWFRSLIVVVVLLLAAESFMARWFGGGRT